MSVWEGLVLLIKKLGHVFFSAGSAFSLTSLACALVIAAGFFMLRRRRKNRSIRIRTIVRALFPKRITASQSHATDIGYFFLSTFVFGLILGWAMLSYEVVSNVAIGQLVGAFGAAQPTSLPEFVPRIATTLALFLAYELAYWLDHYLSHRVPILWEFHKIHHEATVLTPLTMFRIHPVDGLVHANITALILGATNGGVKYLFGDTGYQYAIGDANLIFVLFVHAYVHLQHTQLWIPFRGILGRVFLSPAHHQVHHSSDPVHFNKNLGSCLAVWDWLFGTLYIPGKEAEKLRYGLDRPQDGRRDVHSIARGLVEPFLRVFAHLSRGRLSLPFGYPVTWRRWLPSRTARAPAP